MEPWSHGMDARFAALQEALADYEWVVTEAHFTAANSSPDTGPARQHAVSTYQMVLAYVSRRDSKASPLRRSS